MLNEGEAVSRVIAGGRALRASRLFDGRAQKNKGAEKFRQIRKTCSNLHAFLDVRSLIYILKSRILIYN